MKQHLVWDMERARPLSKVAPTTFRRAATIANRLEDGLRRPFIVVEATNGNSVSLRRAASHG